jgi:hypothetical protein
MGRTAGEEQFTVVLKGVESEKAYDEIQFTKE